MTQPGDGWDAMADIGRLGLETAATVVERLLDLSRQVPLLSPNGDGDAARRLRSDAERLIDMYAEWTRSLVDRAIEVAGSADVLVLGPVAPGDTVAGTAYLHGRDGGDLRVTPLTSPAGPTLSAAAALQPDGSVVVSAQVPSDTTAGRYHGHLLLAGPDEVALPVQIVVS